MYTYTGITDINMKVLVPFSFLYLHNDIDGSLLRELNGIRLQLKQDLN